MGVNSHIIPFTHKGKRYSFDKNTREIHEIADLNLPTMNELVAYGEGYKPEEKDQDVKKKSAESYGSSGGPKCPTRANVPKNCT